MNNSSKLRNLGTKRRAVGGIIAGVILAAILVTTVLVYFVTILNNEKVKTAYTLQSEQDNREKAAEEYTVTEDEFVVGGSIDVTVENTGPIPLNATYSLVYCIEGGACSSPSAPIDSQTLNVVLNPGDSHTANVGNSMLVDGSKYRIDVISERGNIFNSGACLVNGTICVPDTVPGPIPPGTKSLVTRGIIQGTGSLQLDFKAFGALFPELGNRAGVNQTGALVRVSSPYGYATGYPAFDVPQGLSTVVVEKARNLDPSEQALMMNRNTGLVVNVGKTTSGQPDPNYLCKATRDPSGKLILSPYNEGANNVTIPYTDPELPDTVGWVELFFCSQQPATNNNPWVPDAKFNNINGIFLVARGTFTNVFAEYAQTIPYQSIAVGKAGISQLNACLYDHQTDNAPCPLPKTTSAVTDLKYSATAAQMETGTGVKVYLHINTASPKDPTAPFDVSWLYPDGNYTKIATTPNFIPGTRNLELSLPTGDSTASDGANDIGDDCAKYADSNGDVHYSLIVTDSYDSASNKNVYYMTFRMDCS